MRRASQILCLLVILFVEFGIGHAFGANVTDNGSGNQGYILVNDGSFPGHRGVWTNPATMTSLKGPKGDKGDKGDQGIQGIQGLKGDKGIQGLPGINGLDGIDGINGMNGIDGINGIDGLRGDKGDTGADGKDVDPATVVNLQNNIDTESNIRSSADTVLQSNIHNVDDSIKVVDIKQTTWNSRQDSAINTLNNRVDNLDNRVSKLEKTQYKIQSEFRIYDDKHITISPYISNNITRSKMDEVGIRVVFKIGKSYEEKEIEKSNKRIEELEKRLGTAPVIEKVVTDKGVLKSISIDGDGLKIQCIK